MTTKKKPVKKNPKKKPLVKTVVEKEGGPGNCFNCYKLVGSELYCYGCKEWICDDCEKAFCTSGFGHPPEEHLSENYE